MFHTFSCVVVWCVIIVLLGWLSAINSFFHLVIIASKMPKRFSSSTALHRSYSSYCGLTKIVALSISWQCFVPKFNVLWSNVLYISHGIQRSFKIRVKFSWWFWHPVKSCDSYINVFYYSFIISCMFCANYKVREGFEFSREELGVKDEQQIDLRFQALRVLKFQAWRFSCAFIVAFSDLIRKMYVEKKRDLEFCTVIKRPL